jgi:hypothetical protein
MNKNRKQEKTPSVKIVPNAARTLVLELNFLFELAELLSLCFFFGDRA